MSGSSARTKCDVGRNPYPLLPQRPCQHFQLRVMPRPAIFDCDLVDFLSDIAIGAQLRGGVAHEEFKLCVTRAREPCCFVDRGLQIGARIDDSEDLADGIHSSIAP
jgi:hypothetical protein